MKYNIKGKLNTVNVLEIIEGVPKQIVSFKDDSKGNMEAERLFGKMAGKNGAKTKNLESHIEDGYYSHIEDGYYDTDTMTYGVYLIHS